MRARSILLASLAVAAILGTAENTVAQSYPSHAITMIVPFPAGGPADTIGRMVAEGMRLSVGQQVIIENIAGATGSIAAARLAHAEPDGYTIGIGNTPTHVWNGAAYALQYDLVKDFEPISPLVNDLMVIVANNSMPAKDLKELIAWLKANPDKGLAGTSGVGAGGHLAGVLFQNMTGTRFQFVPYRGTAPMMQDLLAGQIGMTIDVAASSVPLLRSGTIKAYAVTAKSRLAAAPDVPTVDEAGLPGFYMTNWHGLWAPAATPKHVVAKLNAAVVDALANPLIRSRLADLGQEIFPREQQSPEALRALQKAEIAKWWPIIKEAGIKAE